MSSIPQNIHFSIYQGTLDHNPTRVISYKVRPCQPSMDMEAATIAGAKTILPMMVWLIKTVSIMTRTGTYIHLLS